MKAVYHGWIVVEQTDDPSHRIVFHAELRGEEGMIQPFTSTDVSEVITWWDKKVGEPVKLLTTPLGGWRVYTGDL